MTHENQAALQDPFTGINGRLTMRLIADCIRPDELQRVVCDKGYFPANVPVRDYPQEFVTGWCLPHWEEILGLVAANRTRAEFDRLLGLLDDSGSCLPICDSWRVKRVRIQPVPLPCGACAATACTAAPAVTTARTGGAHTGAPTAAAGKKGAKA